MSAEEAAYHNRFDQNKIHQINGTRCTASDTSKKVPRENGPGVDWKRVINWKRTDGKAATDDMDLEEKEAIAFGLKAARSDTDASSVVE